MFEGISSFLHHKRHRALQKAVNVINSRSEIDHNRVYHLEVTMIMYGKYNLDILIELVKTVHQMQNITTWKEKIFVSKINEWLKHKLMNIHNEFDYSIDTMLFLTTVKEKLYNILLPINHYTGNITTKCHCKGMSDNRDLTEVFHQKVSSLSVSIASDS